MLFLHGPCKSCFYMDHVKASSRTLARKYETEKRDIKANVQSPKGMIKDSYLQFEVAFWVYFISLVCCREFTTTCD